MPLGAAQGAHEERARQTGTYLSSTDRQRLADQRKRLGWRYVDDSPASPEIAFMRDMLTEDRRMGYDFDEVYEDNVRVALSIVPDKDRELAVTVLLWARPHFARGWNRERVSALSPELVEALNSID